MPRALPTGPPRAWRRLWGAPRDPKREVEAVSASRSGRRSAPVLAVISQGLLGLTVSADVGGRVSLGLFHGGVVGGWGAEGSVAAPARGWSTGCPQPLGPGCKDVATGTCSRSDVTASFLCGPKSPWQPLEHPLCHWQGPAALKSESEGVIQG